jgi:flavin-binding protein dodecin
VIEAFFIGATASGRPARRLDPLARKSQGHALEPAMESRMSNHVYKLLELVGSSTQGTDDAIRQAIETAAKTVRNIDWFEVTETRGHVVGGKVAHFQVTLKVGFRLES